MRIENYAAAFLIVGLILITGLALSIIYVLKSNDPTYTGSVDEAKEFARHCEKLAGSNGYRLRAHWKAGAAKPYAYTITCT